MLCPGCSQRVSVNGKIHDLEVLLPASHWEGISGWTREYARERLRRSDVPARRTETQRRGMALRERRNEVFMGFQER
jgi:hypothetical protein